MCVLSGIFSAMAPIRRSEHGAMTPEFFKIRSISARNVDRSDYSRMYTSDDDECNPGGESTLSPPPPEHTVANKKWKILCENSKKE